MFPNRPFRTWIVAGALALCGLVAPGHAATIPPDAPLFDGEILRAGNATYDIDGNRLGRITLRGLAQEDVLSRSVFDTFTTSNVLGIYAGSGLEALADTLTEFDDLSDGFQVASDARLSGNGQVRDAIWVLWEGVEDAVFVSRRQNGRAREIIVSAQVNRSGRPIDPAVVPLPAPFWLLLSGIAALAVAGRWRGRRAAPMDQGRRGQAALA